MKKNKVIAQKIQQIYHLLLPYLPFINYEVIDRTDQLELFTKFLTEKDKITSTVERITADLNLNFNPLAKPEKNFWGVPQKKSHEINCLIQHFSKTPIHHLVDIGSGKGHLAKELYREGLINSALLIDMDESLQKMGRELLSQEEQDSITFFQQTVTGDSLSSIEEIKAHSSLCGLHACGPLSEELVHHFASENLNELISIGCCYHKIKNYAPLSQLGQEFSLPLTRYALNLANHSNQVFDKDKVAHKKKIRSYRYLINLYFLQKKGFHLTKIRDFRKAPKDLETYLDLCEDILDKLNFDRKEFQLFIGQTRTQVLLETILDLVEFRLIFGRVLELYIILDRAQYLLEKNYQIDVKAVFDNQISPRNLLLHAYR